MEEVTRLTGDSVLVTEATRCLLTGDHGPLEERPTVELKGKSERVGLYAALLAARRTLPPGDADAIDHDEHAGWLRVRRGEHTLLANLSRTSVHVPVDHASEVVLATHHATVEPGYIVLAPQSGALVR